MNSKDIYLEKVSFVRSFPFLVVSLILIFSSIIDFKSQVQATWLYLEPIFSSEDIQLQMPLEGEKFREVDDYWYEHIFIFMFD